jgi:uncharacterized phage protein (TIGR01671 family)
MQREIKFRAWHQGYKKSLINSGANPTMIYPIQQSDVFKWKEEGQPVIIMQYTGLKDSKGVEIYEGDIVMIYDNMGSSHIYQIKWKPDVYMIVGEGGPGEWLCLEEFEGCEVIGNVYQHPHLIS